MVSGTRRHPRAAGRDGQSGAAGRHPKSGGRVCAGALPLADAPWIETRRQSTSSEIRSDDEEGASPSLSAWAGVTRRSPRASLAGESPSRALGRPAKRWRWLQPRGAGAEASPSCLLQTRCPGTRSNGLCRVLCNATAPPSYRLKNLKWKKNPRETNPRVRQHASLLLLEGEAGAGSRPQRFPSPRCSGGGGCTPHSVALDISVIKALNFLLVRMSKHCSFQIHFDEVQQSILERNIYSLLPQRFSTDAAARSRPTAALAATLHCCRSPLGCTRSTLYQRSQAPAGKGPLGPTSSTSLGAERCVPRQPLLRASAPPRRPGAGAPLPSCPVAAFGFACPAARQ